MRRYREEGREWVANGTGATRSAVDSTDQSDHGHLPVTLFNWRNRFRHGDKVEPADPLSLDIWRGEEKTTATTATDAMNEEQQPGHRRTKYPNPWQIERWQVGSVATRFESPSITPRSATIASEWISRRYCQALRGLYG
jgi:hypothetical protein